MEADTPVPRARLVLDRCDALARYSEEPDRLTRPYGSPSLRAAQDLVAGWMAAVGMTVRRDAVGNLIGRIDSRAGSSRTLLLGSHLDSVRDAGKYDGPLGVLVALAAVEELSRRGTTLPFAVEVVAFADEEGLRFQSTYLGSRAVAGTLDDETLDLRDRGGVSVREAIVAFGGDPGTIASAVRDRKELLGYVEVHIEQGPVLEAEGLPVGIVEAIAGASRVTLTFSGEAGHAGTVPMGLRRDAFAAAAEFTLAVEAQARAVAGLVATVGQVEVEPGASNVIPGRARLSLDLRHAADATRQRAAESLRRRAADIAAARRVDLDWRPLMSAPVIRCDEALSRALEEAAAGAGLRPLRLVSGAGHDAVALAPITPVAMLFVRCAGGVSHNPREAVALADVAVAIDVVDRLLDRLSQATRSGDVNAGV